MKMKKILAMLLIVSLMLLPLAACAGDGAAPAQEYLTRPDGTPITISWIGKTLNNPWWISTADFAMREAQALGVNMTIALPQEEVDLERQVAMVEAAIEQGVCAIIISPVSSEGIIPVIQRARDAGIVIVNFDTRIADPNMYDAFLGGDDVLGAYKAGRFIAEQMGGVGEVGLITGLMAQSTGIDRREGFMRAMANYPDITVVAEASAEWRSDLANDVTTNMLMANPNIGGIFASNDQMAVGMVTAVQASERDINDIILVGYDGILDAVNLMADGQLDALTALPNIEQGQIGVRIAVALVMNPDYRFERELIFDTPLVTVGYFPGLTDLTIYEFASIHFPLRGITATGY